MKRKQEPATSPSHPKKTKPSASDTVPSLQELLDFNQIGNSEQDINRRFNHIAKTLLHEFHLVVVVKDTQEIQFEILEAEFYLQILGRHEDPFTHGSEEQKITGTWYITIYYAF